MTAIGDYDDIRALVDIGRDQLAEVIIAQTRVDVNLAVLINKAECLIFAVSFIAVVVFQRCPMTRIVKHKVVARSALRCHLFNLLRHISNSCLLIVQLLDRGCLAHLHQLNNIVAVDRTRQRVRRLRVI